MNIGGFQKLSLLDFPGEVACIVFTSGCDFRCPFCHNASLVTSDDMPHTDESDIFAYLEKRSGVLDGVVITGGEPLIHSDIKDFIIKIRSLGLKIKLDTNGSFPKKLKELLSENLLDYVAMDIKHTRTGYSLAADVNAELILPKIEESIFLLKNADIPAEFRTTLVKGIHTESDAGKIAKELSTSLPYYLQSYTNSGDVISPNGLTAFTEDELSRMLRDAKEFCPNAALRGVT